MKVTKHTASDKMELSDFLCGTAWEIEGMANLLYSCGVNLSIDTLKPGTLCFVGMALERHAERLNELSSLVLEESPKKEPSRHEVEYAFVRLS